MGALHKDRSWCTVLKKTWSTGEGNGKPLQDSCLVSPINSMKRKKKKRKKDMALKDELPSSVGAQ